MNQEEKPTFKVYLLNLPDADQSISGLQNSSNPNRSPKLQNTYLFFCLEFFFIFSPDLTPAERRGGRREGGAKEK